MVELIQVVDCNRNKLIVKDRDAIHRNGDWHETFQCWFLEMINEEPTIYLQRRSTNKKDFPGMYDITAAGHLLVNESVEDGVREIKEELGIEIEFNDLHYLAAIPNSIKLENFIDNEISLVYLYIVDKPIHFIFQDGEVEGMVKVKLEDLERLCVGKRNSVVGELIKVNNSTCATLIDLKLENIVPHEKDYFIKVFKEIKNKL